MAAGSNLISPNDSIRNKQLNIENDYYGGPCDKTDLSCIFNK